MAAVVFVPDERLARIATARSERPQIHGGVAEAENLLADKIGDFVGTAAGIFKFLGWNQRRLFVDVPIDG